ncbi:MAG TPA: MMPL family transporter [Myxococcota bacterium]|nr:MMPL family transporter [Myxococcota bacterium]
MRKLLGKFAERYVAFVISRYWLILSVALVVTVLAAISASRFTLKTDFAELLPQDEPSVKDLDRAEKRMGGLSNMIVTVSGDDLKANRRLTDDIVEKLSSLPKEYIVYIKYNYKAEKSFYEKHKHLYVGLDDLSELYRRLHEKIRYERIKNNPVLDIDFDGEELKPVGFEISDLKKKYKKKGKSYDRYINGYFTGEKGHLYAILVYPPGSSTSVDFGEQMLFTIKKSVAEVCAGGTALQDADGLDGVIRENCRRRYGPSIEVGFAGSVVTAIDEEKAIVDDLVLVTGICLFFVALVVLLYFRTIRSLPIIGIPLIMGTTWTFGISIYIVGHLNTSTAFLAAIIVGNGINFGLIQLARYVEERRDGGDLASSITNAMSRTAKATSTAALAASIAYGSLIITRFRGFNGFGYMGGLGMVLCWLSAFSVQPALMVMLEKILPESYKSRAQRLHSGLFARPYAKFVLRFGVPLHILAGIFAIICILVAVPYLKDPFEYDFRNLRNQSARMTGSGALTNRVDRIFEKRLNPVFILADRHDQVPLITAVLHRENLSGPREKLFQSIVSIFSFLPDNQPEKIKVLKKLRKLLSKSALSWMTEEERQDVEEYLPPKNLKPVTIADLPFALTRMFTELDGTRGMPVALYPRHGFSIWDGHFLMQLAEASRVVTLPDGERVTSAGTSTVFADMIAAIERDGPRAVLASLLGIMLLVLIAYRSWRFILLIMLALFYSIVWMIGPVAMMDMRLNFLNFIALPITFGIGIDYTVNVLNRYRIEGPGSIRKVIGSTGGAVILCSLTTLIGYSSLLIADNQALVSFGILADIGEIASLAAAVLMVPLVVRLIEQRKQKKKAQKVRRAVTQT